MPENREADGRRERLESVFHEALERPPELRSSFLEQVCGPDVQLRRDVESLLRAPGAGGSLMDRPAAAQFGLAGVPAVARPLWAPGAVVGPYRIVERLGAGGMGEVFRARDMRLDRDIALKTLSPALSHERSYIDRLRREARALALVNHPNVATIYGIEETEGQVVVAMELVEGETLAQRLARGRLKIVETLAVASQIAEGVAAAHRKGVVHRDLKPGNVMLMRGGAVKVVDFGLAKCGAAPGADAATLTELTMEGAVMGTPGYMSPEQAEGLEVDARSDIFSFATMVYEMAAGRAAFEGATAAQRLASVLRDQPPEISADAPKRLARLIGACLRKNPDERYQSMADVALALGDVTEELEGGDAAAPIRSSRRWWIGAVGGAAGVAGIWAIAGMRREEAPPVVVTPLTMYEGSVAYPAISPDGKMVAFSWGGEHQDDIDIYVKVLGPGEPLRLTHNPMPDICPLWSPDGRTIAFSRLRDSGGVAVATETIFTAPVLGGPERMVGRGFASDWSPDGSMFLAKWAPPGEAASWMLVPAADGPVRRLVETPAGSSFGMGRFSPDGRKVYYVESTGPADSHLNEIDVGGGTPRRVPIVGLRSIGSIAWASATELLLSGTPPNAAVQKLYRVTASGGTPRALPFGNAGAHTRPGAGALVYLFDQSRDNIWRVGAWPGMDRQPRKWIVSEAPSLTPSISPAGDRIAFSSNRSAGWTIWATDVEGNGAAPVVQFPAGGAVMVGSPAWSPDGKRLAFDAYIGNSPNIFVANVESGRPRQLTTGNGRNVIPSWSRDGRWIYYTTEARGAQTIWRIPPDGGSPQQITRNGGYSAKLSPDGKYLYYLRGRKEGELWRAPVEGGTEELLVREFKSRNFSVINDGVYMLDPGVSEMSPMARGRARFYRFATRKVEELGFESEKPINHYGICLSPDGKWLYYTQADRSGSNIMLVENFR